MRQMVSPHNAKEQMMKAPWRNKENSPLKGKCLIGSVIYHATITLTNPHQNPNPAHDNLTPNHT